VDAADESRRNALLEAELDEADELFAAAVWHCCSEKFISTAGSTDRCSSAKLFIRRNPVGGVDAVFVAGGEDGDGATRPCRETLIPWHLKSCIFARTSRGKCTHA
jgi:hypothetical protein